jgi:hypothetical protein
MVLVEVRRRKTAELTEGEEKIFELANWHLAASKHPRILAKKKRRRKDRGTRKEGLWKNRFRRYYPIGVSLTEVQEPRQNRHEE